MINFTFESEFTDLQENVLRVFCTDTDGTFSVLIDTYNDPYMIYYPLGIFDGQMEEEFREQIFNYLVNKYPDRF